MASSGGSDGLTGNGTCACAGNYAGTLCAACSTTSGGPSCTSCPASCGNGACWTGLSGTGLCNCTSGFANATTLATAGVTSCTACASGYYGASCLACACGFGGVCNQTMSGNGVCTCKAGFAQPTACGSAQIVSGGQCIPCGLGAVKSTDGASCTTCSTGTVKFPSSSTTQDATCVAALVGCASSQIPSSGQCVACGVGLVRSADGLSCTACGSGLVKWPNNNFVADAVCVSALTACGTAQYASAGTCTACALGQLRNGTGDGCTATSCSAGFVRFPDTTTAVNASCVSSLTVCGTAQYAGSSGSCTACTYGYVRSADGSNCTACPDPTVKFPNTNTAIDAACVSPLAACGTGQFGSSGQCAACTYGYVRNANGSACVVCGDGLVKVPDTTTAVDASCQPALSYCGTAQAPSGGGRCYACGYGQVRSANGTVCVACGAGLVKTPNTDSAGDAACVSAASICSPPSQYAVSGSCTQCARGYVASADSTSCVVCDNSTVKVPQNGNGVCTPVLQVCGTAQYPSSGNCGTCGFGLVRSTDGTSCTVCPNGTVKSPDASNAGFATCISALVGCGTNKYAFNGYCVVCPRGAVRSTDGQACEACPAGTAKFPDPDYGVVSASGYYNNNANGYLFNLTSDAACLPATSVCGTAQASVNGSCTACPLGSVRNGDGSACTPCADGTAKVPDSDRAVDAVCTAAVAACDAGNRVAVNGSCVSCSTVVAGSVANADRTACLACPPTNATDAYWSDACANASVIQPCGTAQYALDDGSCVPCSYGLVANATGTGCTVCPFGSVKVPASATVVNAACMNASQVCGSAQIASSGTCTPCGFGAVANADYTACAACAYGTVKVPA